MSPTILVTGGAGFIGSHTCVALAEAGYAPLILDNLGNSDARVLDRLARIIGTAPRFVEGDVRDRALLDRLFREEAIGGVIHFAGHLLNRRLEGGRRPKCGGSRIPAAPIQAHRKDRRGSLRPFLLPHPKGSNVGG